MVKEIPLTKGYVALVDDADYERVSAYKWHVAIDNRPGKNRPDVLYARRSFHIGRVDGKKIVRCERLHHFILGSRHRVDHIDLDGLNNQRSNLRHVTTGQNNANRRKKMNTSSRFKGVALTRPGVWRVSLRENGRMRHVGYFRDEEAAGRAYDVAAREVHGEFARLNFPDERIAA